MDAIFVVQSVITQGLGALLGLGLLLNICGIGYTITKDGVVIRPLSEMRQDVADRRFVRDASRTVNEAATPDALRLRGGAAAAERPPHKRRRAARAAQWARSHAEELVHLFVCAYTTRHAWTAVLEDQWTTIRLAPEQIEQRQNKHTLLRRRRATRLAQTLGTGYTPRMTFLAGLMLRSLQLATRLHKVFDVTYGYAAGATLAASFAHREWLPCIMLGWGAGGLYWSAFRVRPPGVPKSAVKLRLI